MTRRGLRRLARALPWLLLVGVIASAQSLSRRPAWADLSPIQTYLVRRGVTAATLDDVLDRAHAEHVARVREGDLDHLVFYALQSTRVTRRPPIEPALSAKTLVDGLQRDARAAFLEGSAIVDVPLPPGVEARIADLLAYLQRPALDERADYFRQLVDTAFPDRHARAVALGREYVRAMRFLYQKEFLAQRNGLGPAAVQDLYRTRGLSTDTAVESGFVVHTGLAVLRAIDPARRVRRVLIVGPGLDLAPRTGFLEDSPPQSYQPWSVMDALVTLGLSRIDDLSIVGADINPRVVAHLQRARQTPPSLVLDSALAGDSGVVWSADYRDYFARLGQGIGTVTPADGARRTLRIHPTSARALAPAAQVDIVTERLAGPAFDLVVATNVFPYFDDVELALAMSHLASLMAPGSVLLHNEGRVVLGDIAADLGLPVEQARHVTIAAVRGAPAPLGDSVFLHRKSSSR